MGLLDNHIGSFLEMIYTLIKKEIANKLFAIIHWFAGRASLREGVL